MICRRNSRLFCFQIWAFNTLFLLTLIGVRYHMARVVHGHCHRHGQLIHLQRISTKAAPCYEDVVLLPSNSVEDPHHCLLMKLLSQWSMVVPVARSLAGEVAGCLLPHRLGQTPLTTIPLLLQSPQVSPPPLFA